MVERYTPTQAEYERARGHSEALKVSGDSVFATVQGEGVTAGRPSVFLRLQNCNLHCGQSGIGWRCDTWYTWDTSTPEYWQEATLVSVEAAASEIQQAWQTSFGTINLDPNLVITGGEPLLQQPKIHGLLQLLKDWSVEIETNGTIIPQDYLLNYQINCSPKLESSGNSLSARRNLKALRRIAQFPNHWFKFVIAEPSDAEEVKALVSEINGGDFSRVLLMGEGTDPQKLIDQDVQLGQIAKEIGCLTTRRNHIFWFGDKRRT